MKRELLVTTVERKIGFSQEVEVGLTFFKSINVTYHINTLNLAVNVPSPLDMEIKETSFL